MSTYRAVMLTKKGGPDVLEIVELPLRDPEPGEVRIRVLACGVGATDVLMRRGYYPYAPKIPFVQGYDVVGTVDAIGPDPSNSTPAGTADKPADKSAGRSATKLKVGDKVCALTVHGGYAEQMYRSAEDFVPVPAGLDDAEVVALILNYATAYQMIHRVGRQTAGQTALVTGANGGVGQALLELLRVVGVKAYGAAGARSRDLVTSLGGIPIEGRAAPADRSLREALPEGVDVAYDALGGKYTAQCIRATRRGGMVIGYGFSGAVNKAGNPSFLSSMRGMMSIYVGARLRGRKTAFYGITGLYRKNKQPFLEDMPKLFELLAAGKVKPKIVARLPLLDAKKGNEMQEAGGIDGKIVLVRAD